MKNNPLDLTTLRETTDKETLMGFWLATTQGYSVARFYFPDRPKGYVRATRDLGHYAANRAAYLSCVDRDGINSQRAQCYAYICAEILARLPHFAASRLI